MELSERIAALFRMFLLLTVLVAVGLISAITTIRLAIHGRQATMPNLVGVQLDAAERIADSRGLELKVEDKLFSTQYAANEIASQMPAAGTRLKEGQHVHVLVSLGPPRVSIPNLVGDSFRAARIVAIQRGLNVGDVVPVHWTGGLEDHVLVQDPAPGTVEVHSPAVNLLVSLGQAPEAYLCPSFVGRPLPEARRALDKAGFKLGAITPIPTDITPKGTILTQSPPPGSKIDPDTAFAFQVAD